MAPEMLFHGSYDYRIDVWALGVLLYEMVHGHAPFRGDSVSEVKERMLRGSYELSDALSDSLKDLITDILKFDPQERITLKDILTHQWVADMQDIICNCPEQQEVTGVSHVHGLLHKLEEKPTREGKSSTKKERQPTRNISFNLSINNFGYIKPTDRSNFHSPSEAFLEKKKKKD
jgi:serine/threonine protein kinase